MPQTDTPINARLRIHNTHISDRIKSHNVIERGARIVIRMHFFQSWHMVWKYGLDVASNSKVCQHSSAVQINEHIGGLQVPMADASIMQ